MTEPSGHIGTEYVEIRPDASGFVEKLRGQILPGADKTGRDFGDQFWSGFSSAKVPDIFNAAQQSRTKEKFRSGGRAAGDAFSTELTSRVGSAIEALPDIELKADASDAERKVAELRADLLGLKKHDIDLGLADEQTLNALDDIEARLKLLTGPEQNIRIRVDSAAALAQLAAIRKMVNDLDKDETKLGDDASKASKKSADGFSLLHSVIEPLGPALIPLAGAVADGVGSIGAVAVTAALAVKGAEADIKSGTQAGQDFAAGVNTIKSDLSELQRTAAHGVLTPFEQSIDSIHSKLPELDNFVERISSQAGGVAEKGLDGLLGGFQTFEPDIEKTLGYVDQLAGRFESWATGPGGASFAAQLGQDLDTVAPAVESIATAGGHLVQALSDEGSSVLGVLGGIASVLDHLPVGALEVMTTSYIAFRTAVAVTSGIDAAAAAIGRLSVAEEANAAASRAAAAGAARGGAAGILGAVGRYAGPIVGLDLGAQVLGNAAANGGWGQSTNGVEALVGDVAQGLGLLARGRPDLILSTDAQNKAIRAAVQSAQDDAKFFGFNGGDPALAKYGLTPADVESIKMIGRTETLSGIPVLPNGKPDLAYLRSGANLQGLPSAASVLRGDYAAVYQPAASRINTSQTLLNQQLSRSSIAASSQPLDAQVKSLNNLVDSTQKFLSLGGQTVLTYHGITVGENTYAQALKQSDGDRAKAIASIESQIDVHKKAATSLSQVEQQQERLDSVVGAAASKYNLTTDQVSQYAAAIGLSTEKVASGAISQRDFVADIGQVAHAVANGSASFTQAVTAIEQFTSSEDTAQARGQLIGQLLTASSGDAIGYANSMVQAASANQQFVNDLADAPKGLINWKKATLDYHNAAAAPLINDLQQIQTAAQGAAAATYQHRLQTESGTKAAQDAYQVYVSDTRQALVDEAGHFGATNQQAKNFADTYFNLANAKDIKKSIEAIGADKTNTILSDILNQLRVANGLPPLKIRVDDSQITTARTELDNLIAAGRAPIGSTGALRGAASGGAHGESAAGSASWTTDGFLPPGLSTVGESTNPRSWEAAITDSRGRTKILSNADSVALFNRLGIKPPAFAGGTGPGDPAKLGKQIDNAEQRLKTVQGQLKDEISSVRSSFQSLFDITTAGQASLPTSNPGGAGTVGGTALTGAYSTSAAPVAPSFAAILAEGGQDKKIASEYDADVHALAKLRLNKTELAQLAAATPSAAGLAQLQALLSGGKAGIAEINSDFRSITKSGTDLGKFVGGKLYDSKIKIDQSQLDQLKTSQSAVAKAIKNSTDRMASEVEKAVAKLNRPIVIKIDGREIARATASGKIANGRAN